MNDILIDLNVLHAEPEADYHAKAKDNLSSHQVIDFMRSPWLYWKKRQGLIPEEESNAFLLGRGAHVRILQGRKAYEEQYAIGGPINPRTQKPFGSGTQAFADWAAKIGKPVLSQEQADLIEAMADGVSRNAKAMELLSAGVAEGVVRTTYCGLPCQARIDWLNPRRGIVDLKTVDDIDWAEADFRRWRYATQLGFYKAVFEERLRAGLGNLHGLPSVPVTIIAIEKREPYRCGCWKLTDNTLAVAKAEIDAAIGRLVQCEKTNEWPTGYEQMRVLDVV